jgi:hypothetical protein
LLTRRRATVTFDPCHAIHAIPQGGYVYHALNRAAARQKLFRKDADYKAFLRLLDEALERHPARLLGYCIMPTRWHVVLWPAADHELTFFLRWLTLRLVGVTPGQFGMPARIA